MKDKKEKHEYLQDINSASIDYFVKGLYLVTLALHKSVVAELQLVNFKASQLHAT